jgi:glycerol-3-phosphate dehydrogenase
VQHLDDLLLRRTRLGVLLPNGAEALLERVREICSQELGWNHQRWEEEVTAYRKLIATSYSLPATVSVSAVEQPKAVESHHRRWVVGAFVGAMVVWRGWRWVRQP